MIFRHSMLLLLGITFAGCSDGPAARTLTHLDPRLADKRSPAAALAATRRTVESYPFGGTAELPAPWRLEKAEALLKEGVEGLLLAQASPDKGPLRIVFGGSFHAGLGKALEVEVLRRTSLTLRMVWLGKDGRSGHVEAFMPGSDDFQSLLLFPGFHPLWSGELAALWIEPKWPTLMERMAFRIRGIRLIEVGYPPKYTPLDGDSGDGGLVQIGLEARRAWPADLGIPLLTQCTVPRDGRFHASAAVLPDESKSPVRFILDARMPGGKWRRLAEELISSEEGWRPFRADLRALAKEKVELRMSASREGIVKDESVAPERTACLWGEPMVSGLAAGSKRPNILLVTLDTARADHVGDEMTTPCFARLGKEGIVFENAWSGCNSTLPSHASILTGVHIYEHGALNNRTAFPESNVTLAERLRAAGYHTAAAVSIPILQADRGFGQGFDRFRIPDDRCHMDGGRTMKPVIEWITEWGKGWEGKKGDRPYFLWLHLYDPHTPYGPPEGFEEIYAGRGRKKPLPKADPPTLPLFDGEMRVHRKWLEEFSNRDYVDYLYGAGVSYTDHLMEQLLECMKEKGLYDDTAILVTADHGESLGEHRIWYQHVGLYEESLRVPLIIKVPNGPVGVRIEAPVITLDIAPTLLKLCGLEPMPGMSGKDLLAIAKDGGDPARRLWFENASLKQLAVRDSRYHFILTTKDLIRYLEEDEVDPDGRTREKPARIEKKSTFLYDIRNDPKLDRNLAAEESKVVEAYLELIKHWHESMEKGEVKQRRLSEEEEARLRELGYLGN